MTPNLYVATFVCWNFQNLQMWTMKRFRLRVYQMNMLTSLMLVVGQLDGVNNLIKSGSKKSPGGHASNLTQTHMAATNMTGMERGHTPGQLSGIPSASVTATTVF